MRCRWASPNTSMIKGYDDPSTSMPRILKNRGSGIGDTCVQCYNESLIGISMPPTRIYGHRASLELYKNENFEAIVPESYRNTEPLHGLFVRYFFAVVVAGGGHTHGPARQLRGHTTCDTYDDTNPRSKARRLTIRLQYIEIREMR